MQHNSGEINFEKDALEPEPQSENRLPSQKDVTGRIVPTDFQKFLITIYSLLKMTTGCYTLASEPEPMKTPIKSIFSNTSNFTQCFNIPSSRLFALIIRQPLKQLNLTISNKFIAAVHEEHLHYVDLYAGEENRPDGICKQNLNPTLPSEEYQTEHKPNLNRHCATSRYWENNWIQNHGANPFWHVPYTANPSQKANHLARSSQHSSIY